MDLMELNLTGQKEEAWNQIMKPSAQVYPQERKLDRADSSC
jgi:hypothetical protein